MTNSALDSKQINEKIVEWLQREVGKTRVAKEQIARALGVTLDVLYKRLQSNTLFTLQELHLLMNTFHLSLDSLLVDVPFYAKVLLQTQKNPIHSFDDYLTNLDLLFLRLGPLKEVSITYASSEVPLFYYFQYPHLASFKLFVYAKNVWQLPSLQYTDSFSLDLFSPHQIRMVKDLWTKYQNLTSTEIWSPQIWHTTLNQLSFYASQGWFRDQADLKQLLQDIKSCTLQMRKYVLDGHKGQPNSRFQLHANYLFHTNNLILAQKGEQEMLFMTHDNPNYLYSEERELLDYTRSWLEKIKSASPLLNNQRDTTAFFDQLDKKRSRVERDLGFNGM